MNRHKQVGLTNKRSEARRTNVKTGGTKPNYSESNSGKLKQDNTKNGIAKQNSRRQLRSVPSNTIKLNRQTQTKLSVSNGG